MDTSFIKTAFRQSMISKLLIINIAVFLFISVAGVLFYLFGLQGYMDNLAVKYFAQKKYILSDFPISYQKGGGIP